MDAVVRRFYVATFFYTLSHAIGSPLIPTFLHREFASTPLFIGLVMGLYGLMQIFLRLPMGDMADRRGRKPSLLLAYACTMGSALFFVFAASQWWSIPGVLLFGFAGGIFWVAANSYLFDRTERTNVARTTSDYALVLGAAFLIGPPLGHILADTFGFAVAFGAYFASATIGLVLVMALPEVPPAPRPRATTNPYRRAWGLLKHPALAYSALGTFVYSVLFATHNSFFQLHVLAVDPVLLVAGLTLTAVTLAGLLLGGRQLAAILVRIGLPRVLDRYGAVHVLLAGVVVTAIATGFVPFAQGLWSLVLVVAVTGVATGVMIPANLMLVHQGAPSEQRGLANGIYGTMLGVGSALAPITFGFVGTRLGLPWAFWAAAATALALAAVLASRRRSVAPANHAPYGPPE